MFADFIDSLSVGSVIPEDRLMLFPPASDRVAWNSIPDVFRNQILEYAESFSSLQWPVCTASMFMEYVKSGDRSAYENPYFLRRRKLCSAILGYCAEPRDSFLKDIVDGLWCISEETSWVVSAHNGSSHPGMIPACERPLPDIDNPYIDLFAAQTSMIFSFADSLVGYALDGVSPLIRRRIKAELERRIFTPFMSRDDYWWMGFIRKDLCNWTPWIVSNILLSACSIINDRYRLLSLVKRSLAMVDRYLDVIPPDGGCDEGAGYWNMAGGSLVDILDVIEKLTGASFWDNEKIRNIMKFPLRMQLEKGWFVNFADCSAHPMISGERILRAGEMMHDENLQNMGLAMSGSVRSLMDNTAQLWRVLSLVFHRGVTQYRSSLPDSEIGDVWLENTQIRIVRRKNLILVCKGGHNGESHNHNDVGSFMLYVNGEPVVLDAGNLTYTSKTFSDERYTIWNVRSVFHNLPIIGSAEQKAGREYCAQSVVCTENGLSLDISRAYGIDADFSALRAVSLEDSCLSVHDKIITGYDESISWVFMLRFRPERKGSAFICGPVVLTAPDDLNFCIEEIPVTDARMQRDFPGVIYRLVLKDSPSKVHDAVFSFLGEF